jgi:hypothetical protein
LACSIALRCGKEVALALVEPTLEGWEGFVTETFFRPAVDDHEKLLLAAFVGMDSILT